MTSEKLATLDGVNRQLQFSVLHLELAGNRLASASLARNPASSETVASFSAAASAGAFFAASAASAFSEPLVSWAWAEAIPSVKPNAIIAIHRFFTTLSSLWFYGGRSLSRKALTPGRQVG